MRILLVGCGALGGTIARHLATWEGITLAIHDVDTTRARTLATTLGAQHAADLDAALNQTDLVVEAAAQAALRALAPRVLQRGLPLVALSVGALADDAFYAEIEKAAREGGGRLHVPSGAIGALDALRAAKEDGLEEVLITTAKPPAGFGLSDVTEPRVLYEGPAREAVIRYPKNVNVAAALSLAGLGFDKTRVRIVADPELTDNTHTITARGTFGNLTFRVENKPSPDNPASSHLASLAALALIRRLISPVQIGS